MSQMRRHVPITYVINARATSNEIVAWWDQYMFGVDGNRWGGPQRGGGSLWPHPHTVVSRSTWIYSTERWSLCQEASGSNSNSSAARCRCGAPYSVQPPPPPSPDLRARVDAWLEHVPVSERWRLRCRRAAHIAARRHRTATHAAKAPAHVYAPPGRSRQILRPTPPHWASLSSYLGKFIISPWITISKHQIQLILAEAYLIKILDIKNVECMIIIYISIRTSFSSSHIIDIESRIFPHTPVLCLLNRCMGSISWREFWNIYN